MEITYAIFYNPGDLYQTTESRDNHDVKKPGPIAGCEAKVHKKISMRAKGLHLPPASRFSGAQTNKQKPNDRGFYDEGVTKRATMVTTSQKSSPHRNDHFNGY